LSPAKQGKPGLLLRDATASYAAPLVRCMALELVGAAAL
jgi:hypothetical protein